MRMTVLAIAIVLGIGPAAGAQSTRPAEPAADTVLMQYNENFETVARHVARFAAATLTPKPEETLTAEADYGRAKVRYATFTLGDGTDRRFTVALSERPGEGGTVIRRIYVDANNNGDLTDDGDGTWTSIHPAPSEKHFAVVTFQVPYRTDADGEIVRKYRARILYAPRRPTQLFLFRDGYRSGRAKLGGKVLSVALLDEDNDALYDDVSDLGLLIDFDGDGSFDPRPGSGEMLRGDRSFYVGDVGFRLSAVSKTGQLADFVRTRRGLPPRKQAAAPEIAVKALDGSDMSLSALRGKVVLVTFFASWLKACDREAPMLARVHLRYRGKGLAILAISLDGPRFGTGRDNVERFVARHGVPWPVNYTGKAFAENAVARTYGISRLPAYFLLDRRGVLRYDRGDLLEQRPGGWTIEPKLLWAVERLLAEPPETQ